MEESRGGQASVEFQLIFTNYSSLIRIREIRVDSWSASRGQTQLSWGGSRSCATGAWNASRRVTVASEMYRKTFSLQTRRERALRATCLGPGLEPPHLYKCGGCAREVSEGAGLCSQCPLEVGFVCSEA